MTLLELFRLLKKHLKLMIVLPVACALVAAGVSWGALANAYTSTVSVYVLNSEDSQAQRNSNAYSDMNASQLMANDISALASSNTVKEKTADALGLGSLSGYSISVKSSTTTRVIDISVTGSNPEGTATVANELAKTLSSVGQSVMGVKSVNVVDEAKTPVSPSGPPRAMYTGVAFLAGLFVAIAAVVIMDMVNTRVRTPEEAEEITGIPVIGRIPKIKG